MAEAQIVDVNGRECIKHVIKLNDFITTEMLIPVELNIVELNGILKMAKDFLKINEVKTDISQTSHLKYWTEQQIEQLTKFFKDGLTAREIADKLNLKYAQVAYKLNALNLLRKNKNINPLLEEKNKHMINQWSKMSAEEKIKFAEQKNMTIKQMYNKIYRMKQRLNK